jgi:hypothetical protein
MAEPSDRDLVENLLARFSFAHDDSDLDGVVDCFETGGVMRTWATATPGDVAEHRGHEALRANTARSFSLRPHQRRHVTSNVHVRARAVDATWRAYAVQSYLTIIDNRPDGARVVATGVYHDEVVVRDGRALFRSRGVQLDAAPFEAHAKNR